MTLDEVAKVAPILVTQNCPWTADYQINKLSEVYPQHRELFREIFFSYWGFYPSEGEHDAEPRIDQVQGRTGPGH